MNVVETLQNNTGTCLRSVFTKNTFLQSGCEYEASKPSKKSPKELPWWVNRAMWKQTMCCTFRYRVFCVWFHVQHWSNDTQPITLKSECFSGQRGAPSRTQRSGLPSNELSVDKHTRSCVLSRNLLLRLDIVRERGALLPYSPSRTKRLLVRCLRLWVSLNVVVVCVCFCDQFLLFWMRMSAIPNNNSYFKPRDYFKPRELTRTLFGRVRGFVLTNRLEKRVFHEKLTLDTYRWCFGVFQRRSWLNIGRCEFRRTKRGSTANIELIKYVLGCTVP